MKRIIQLFTLCVMMTSVAMAQTVNVTLTVDVSNETVDASGVHVAGNWDSSIEWTPMATPLTDMGNGLWSTTIAVDSFRTFEYKYILGNDWAFPNESIDAEAGCIVGNGNSNRILTVLDTDMVVPTVCYNTCGPCAGDGESQVTFKVDLSKAAVVNSPIFVSGGFPDGMWDETYELRDDNGDLVYTTTFNLPEGEYEYKFRNGADDWEGPAGACVNGNGNRFLTVGAADTILSAQCFGECGPCVVKNVLNVTMHVDMSNVIEDTGISANGVSVAGNFVAKAGLGSDWTPEDVQLEDADGDGIYSISFTLEEGTYQYKFLNGNAWGTEEIVPLECRVSGNREVVIEGDAGADVVVGPVCFNQCEENCPDLLDPVDVTFRVDMSNEFIAQEGLFVAGDFIADAKWVKDTFEMIENVDIPGIYEYTANFRPGFKYAYKFFNGGVDGAENGEETNDFIGSGCGVDNGFGGSNRLLDLSNVDSDIVLPAYVFNSCDLSTLVNNEEIAYFNEFSVYPNPASDLVSINFSNESTEMHKVQLYDARGSLVYDSGFSHATKQEIVRNQLSAGLYIGRVINESNGAKTFKVIFQ